ncbi:MAG: hypothetical protein ABII96_00275 [Candidatus Zixiibacteriota bacterium]
MKGKVKNMVIILIPLCLGFILGRISLSSDVIANPQISQPGRYQLVIGELELLRVTIDARDSSEKTETIRDKTLFRIDTFTGDVDKLGSHWVSIKKDEASSFYDWESMTKERSKRW